MARSLLVAALATGLSQVVLATNVELPPCADQFKPFESVGCFSDANPPALTMRSKAGQGDMTVEKCSAICKGNGFRYSGLKYYGVCFCGAVINGAPADKGQCNLPCNGNRQETCGGDKALSIWEDKTFPKKPDEVAVQDYQPIGCYTDNSSSGRALSYPVKVDGSSLTPQKCIAACKSQGFAYAGTEYGGECWCAPAPSPDTKKVSDSECNVPCNGDKSSSCGGRSRLTVYKAKDLESTEPCKGNPPVSSASTIPPSSVPGSPSAPASGTGPAASTGPASSGPASSTEIVPTEPAPSGPACGLPPTSGPASSGPASSTGPAPTEPAPTGPASSGPAPTEPAPTGPPSSETAPTEPVPTEPVPTGPAPTGPAPTGPAPTGPAPTGPAPTGPPSSSLASSGPPSSETAPTEPVPTEPVPTGPAPTGPAPTEPALTGPGPTEPVPTGPGSSGPAPTEPAPTGPGPTEPVPTGPGSSGPAPTEPAPTGTAPTEPVPTGPGSSGPGSSGPASSTGPAPTEPAPTGPGSSGPGSSGPASSTGPAPTEPAPTEPAPTGPGSSGPGSSGPASSTGPAPTEPAPTEPVPTGPGSSTGPAPTEPAPTEPVPTGPGSSTGPAPTESAPTEPVPTGPGSSTGPAPTESAPTGPGSSGPASSTGPNPPVTTNPTSTRTWTTSTLCASVVTTTPKCEKQIGDWCAPPIPDWSDSVGCLHSAVTCKIQLGVCFKKAGVQNAIKCFEYGKFCEEVKACCLGCKGGSCSKGDCKPSAGTVTTITKPCAAATTTQAPPTNTPVCPPRPENVCVDIGKAVCGIPLPAVSCNDVKADFGSNPFKLYTEDVSSKCRSFPLPKVPEACAQACKEQYDECNKYDFWNCQAGKRSESGAVPRVAAKPGDVNRRTLNFDHNIKCQAQYDACLVANKMVNPADKCKSYGC